MDRLEYENYDEFTCEITDKFDSLEAEFGDVSIIAKYDEAKEIIRELMCLGYDIASVNIHSEEFEKYYDEYRVALNQDGIWCEKFKRESGYFNDDASVVYVMDNCSSAVFKHIESEEIYEVCIGEDDYKHLVDDNSKDDIHGFTMSHTDDNGYHSFSFYTTNPLTKDEMQNMIKKLGFSFSE